MAAALKPDRLTKTVTPVIEDFMMGWGSSVLDGLGAAVSFDLRNPLVKDYLDAWQEQRIVGITDVTRADVTRILQAGVAEGLGIDDLRRKLRGYFEEAADYRAERIARTEVVSSSNAANLAAYQISGLVDGKEWLAVQDDATRETHSEMDGQRRGITEEFVSTSGARAQGPGLFGIGSEDINCRCTVRPVIADLASPAGEERAAEWKRYVASLDKGEKAIKSAAGSVFASWLGDAVQALG